MAITLVMTIELVNFVLYLDSGLYGKGHWSTEPLFLQGDVAVSPTHIPREE